MIEGIGFGTFVFFGSMTVVAFFFVYFCVPETKGVALEDMDVLWEECKGLAPRKRQQFEEIMAVRNRERNDIKLEGEDSQHIEKATV